MIDYNNYTEILVIPLPTTPNASFSVVLDTLTFNIEFRAMGDRMLVYIDLGDSVLVNGSAIKYNTPINRTSQNKYNGGHFWFEGAKDPKFENFAEMRFYFGRF